MLLDKGNFVTELCLVAIVTGLENCEYLTRDYYDRDKVVGLG